MKRRCIDCYVDYDDAESSTLCPHRLIMPREDLDRKIEALKLLGKYVRFAHQAAEGPNRRVESVNYVGMVTIEGMSGEFAPHLFVVQE